MPLKNHPMILACKMGYHKIVTLFVHEDPISELVSKSLIAVMKAPTKLEKKKKGIDYDKC